MVVFLREELQLNAALRAALLSTTQHTTIDILDTEAPALEAKGIHH